MSDNLITKDNLPPLGKDREHKYDHGHALIITGGPGRTGAARLAARGALRIGAGLVTLGVPARAHREIANQISALMATPISDASALAVVLADDRINAICIGPGLGLSTEAEEMVAAVLDGLDQNPARSAVFDADALTILAQRKDLFDRLTSRCVLTPHGGEFARLFPGLMQRLKMAEDGAPLAQKENVSGIAAERSKAVLVFKGSQTVIAHPDGDIAVSLAQGDRAVPWLATAGAGDVLAGFITGLLARGYGPTQAAAAGVWLHVECARAFGPGLIAEDLPEMLPKVFRDLGL